MELDMIIAFVSVRCEAKNDKVSAKCIANPSRGASLMMRCQAWAELRLQLQRKAMSFKLSGSFISIGEDSKTICITERLSTDPDGLLSCDASKREMRSWKTEGVKCRV